MKQHDRFRQTFTTDEVRGDRRETLGIEYTTGPSIQNSFTWGWTLRLSNETTNTI